MLVVMKEEELTEQEKEDCEWLRMLYDVAISTKCFDLNGIEEEEV
jgi:uncharacterized protein YnzC (UPF0291/DUF896 family)